MSASPTPAVREASARYVHLPACAGTLVDSCVLIDVLADDPNWADWSLDQLERCSQQGALIINPIILAEISPRFACAADLEAALDSLPLVREALPWDAAYLAGQAFKVYRQLQGSKTSPLPDFYIGAHALVHQLQLLTRDSARYRSYFPKLALVAP
ncbi:MAG: DNA-binding protein [Betaproteobacteria bacterium HGW-Betaproteobacteria-18]|nr:MAG: DNA-binding protein [Betaproteobacteria bacterium HGW-Betaproteobacteria-18]